MIETTMPETYDETASVMRVLLDQLHATEADRDELAAQVNSMQYELDAVTAIKAERDALTAANGDLRAWFDALKADHDALKDAARLALDALVESEPHPDDANYENAVEAIAALNAVL